MDTNTHKTTRGASVGMRNQARSQTDSLDYGKIPPQALDLEETVLGAMMLEQHAVNKAIEILQPEMFYKDSHQRIYRAIKMLFADSEPVDIRTVTNKLRSTAELDIVGGAYYISSLTMKVASAANIEFHSRIIQQKFIQRELIRISSNIIKDAFEETTDVFDLLDNAEKNLFEIAENNLRRSAVDMGSIVKEAIKKIEEAAKKEGNISGVPSGFYALDNITAGWQPSDLIILAARPGMGKTAFVLSLARNTAVDHNKGVAVFSLEMSSVQLVTRLIAGESEINAETLKKGNLTDFQWQNLNKSIGALTNAPLFIDDTPALSIFELRAKCRRLKAQHDIQLVIIDYLQLMSAGGDKGNREQEISTISRSLKALAKELNIPIITLSQLNRSVETRGGAKRPQLSDLRESGAIEQDADMVCFIYRPDYYGLKSEDENAVYGEGYSELIIAKHRNGSLEDVKLTFIKEYAKFTNHIESFDDKAALYHNSNRTTSPSDGMSANTNFDKAPELTLQSKMNSDFDDLPADDGGNFDDGISQDKMNPSFGFDNDVF